MKKSHWIIAIIVLTLGIDRSWAGVSVQQGQQAQGQQKGQQAQGQQKGQQAQGQQAQGQQKGQGNNTNSVRKIPNNGYARGKVQYGANTINLNVMAPWRKGIGSGSGKGGTNQVGNTQSGGSITPRFFAQNLSQRGARIKLRGWRVIVLPGGRQQGQQAQGQQKGQQAQGQQKGQQAQGQQAQGQQAQGQQAQGQQAQGQQAQGQQAQGQQAQGQQTQGQQAQGAKRN